MNKDIFEIVQYILECSSSVKVHINTNGSMRDPDWWWDFGVMGGERLQVVFDVDGIDQEMHARYRRKTSLAKIKENVEAFAATKAIATPMTIVFKHNVDHLEEINQMCKQWGMTGKHICVPSNRFKGDRFDFINENGEEEQLYEMSVG